MLTVAGEEPLVPDAVNQALPLPVLDVNVQFSAPDPALRI